MAAIQFERGQEGHLSLAARWPQAKPVEEPHSLHPITGTWIGAPEQPHVSFSLKEDIQIYVHGLTLHPNASINFPMGPRKPERCVQEYEVHLYQKVKVNLKKMIKFDIS